MKRVELAAFAFAVSILVIFFSYSLITYADAYSFIRKWGSKGSLDGQFALPSGIAIDSSNDVYILDTGNNRIQKFSDNGTFITKWGSKGEGETQFVEPTAIAIDPVGNIYITDKGASLKKFYSDGSPLVHGEHHLLILEELQSILLVR